MAGEDIRSRQRNRAATYVRRRGMDLGRFLGFGNDGAVWETSGGSVVKIEEREASFEREWSCYVRLKDCNVTNLNGFAVPQLLGFDPELLAIEMTILFPPCILDFAKSYVDRPPDFEPETLADWEQETREMFDSRWPIVRQLLTQLRCIGIYYYDAKPTNIRFEVDETTIEPDLHQTE